MAALAAIAAIALLAPLYRGRRDSIAAGAPALAIYRDQLAEIDRDVASGTIAAGDAEAARTEIARRLIRAGSEAEPANRGGGRAVTLAAIAIIAMPIAAFALYLSLGTPEYPDQPLASRAPSANDIATLIAAVETRLAADPDDGRGWDVIAPVYLRLGRAADAATAYANAIRILGTTADREMGLGESLTAAAGGTVTPEARAAFARAADLAPTDARPRFYLALALQQDGKRDEALAAWRALRVDAPEGADWIPLVETQIAALEQAPALPGPSAEDVEAAADLAPADRQAMIEGMVASLATRLEETPADPAGWARLVRSYMVLGRPDDAKAALAKARLVLAGDANGLASVETAAREAGVEMQE